MLIDKNGFLNDIYHFFKMSEEEQELYLDKWYPSKLLNPFKVKTKKGGMIWERSINTFKKVDEETSRDLYNGNNVPISVYHVSKYNKRANLQRKECFFKVFVWSIDDSCISISSDKLYMNTQKELELINYINNTQIINGKELIDFCVSIGFDKKTLSFN